MKNYEKRIRQTLEYLNACRVVESVPVTNWKIKECAYKHDSPIPTDGSLFEPFEGMWGTGADQHYYFFNRVCVPKAAEEQYYRLRIANDQMQMADLNPQFTLYIDGELRCGMDGNHNSIVLKGGKTYDILLYAYTGTRWQMPLRLNVFLDKVDSLTERLYYDFAVVCEALDVFGYEDEMLVYRVNEAVNLIDFRQLYTREYYRSLEDASQYLQKNCYGSAACLPSTVFVVGHTHIDIAWLWRMEQTEEKAVRSFATAVSLSEKYPEFRFFCAQAILYDFVKKNEPKLYEKIKALVKEGRFEAGGCMWVESDCNLTGGESIIRQIAYGKEFFKEEFDIDSDIVWLPDTFGFPATLPQILKGCGAQAFVTSKLSWNDTDDYPHDTFLWQGRDGTRIFSYFLTAQEKKKNGERVRTYATYAGVPTPSQMLGTWERYRDKKVSDSVLHTFGFGDGGGGPTEEQIEYIRRLKRGLAGIPQVRYSGVGDFIRSFYPKRDTLHVHNGELYLEFHRGTYTTVSWIKKANAECERLLHDIELYCVIYSILSGQEPLDLTNGWKILLAQQFHDILPGSSIDAVYEDSKVVFTTLKGQLTSLLNKVLQDISSYVGEKLVFNALSFGREQILCVRGIAEKFFAPPLGFAAASAETQSFTFDCGEYFIENSRLRVEFDDCYRIARVYDKANGRELLRENGKANVLRVYSGYANGCFDAWEIQDYFDEQFWEIDKVESAQVERFADRVSVKVVRTFLNSTIVQIISLFGEEGYIDFQTQADWQEKNVLLKAEFETNIIAPTATYGIAFGNVQRSTHNNTSWDGAQFEVNAQKYADCSEQDYGAALISDCKYGYSIKFGKMCLSLIKTATYPSEYQDLGSHEFRYAFYCHEGDFAGGKVENTAYAYNRPLLFAEGNVRGTKNADREFSLLRCDAQNVLIETVKYARDRSGYVVRLRETFGKNTKTRLRFGHPAGKVFVTNMLENEPNPISLKENSVEISILPYQIVTLKIVPKK